MEKFLDRFAEIPAKYKYIGLVVFVLLCGGLFYYFVHTPKMEEIHSLEQTLQDLQIKLHEAEEYAARYDEFKEELRLVDLKLKEALKKLPEGREIPDLLDQINESVIEAGLEIASFTPAGQKEMEGGFYYEVPVNIQMSGGYHNFAMFADVISKMERIVTLRNIRLNPLQDGTVLNISCSAVTFRQSTDGEGEQ
jgi:type IV pilus assembly protein PilO